MDCVTSYDLKVFQNHVSVKCSPVVGGTMEELVRNREELKMGYSHTGVASLTSRHPVLGRQDTLKECNLSF